MFKKKSKKKIWIILGIIIILIGGISIMLYKSELQTSTKNLISPIYSSFLSKLSIPVSSGYYTGEFIYELSGNESKWVSEIKFNGREVIIIPKENEKDRTYIECSDYDLKKDICLKEEEKIYLVPETMPVKVLDERIIDISQEQKELETKELINVFVYYIPDDIHYLKIGENSVTITELQVTTQSNLVNITAETGKSNFTHLNISTSAPYSNLIGYWNFDAVEQVAWDNKTIYDFSSNNRDGALEGTAVVSSSGCIFGNCMQLDGVDVVQDPKLDLETKWTQKTTDNMVLMAWVKPSATSATDQRIITSVDECLIRFNGNSLEFLLNSFTDPDRVIRASLKTTGTWQHVVGRYDKATNNMSIFYNGVHVNSSVPSGAYGTCATWNIGSKTGASAGVFNGSIDEVMVFNGTLTDAQILAIYNNQSARFMPTGTQDIVNQSYMNISTGNNRVNVTTYIESLLGSSINLTVGFYNTSNAWFYTTSQVVSSGVVKTFTISGTSTNLTLNYTFYAGNSTNPFYSPIIKNNITYDVWNVAEDTTYPSFSDYYDNNATLLDTGTGYFDVVVKNTNGTVILHINNTNITATLGCQDEPGFYVAPSLYGCNNIYDETACLEQDDYCDWADGSCLSSVPYPVCGAFQSQATCEGSNQADVCTWSYGTSYAFTSAGTYMYNWTSYGNGTSHNINISSNRNYLVNSSVSNCWTKTGNVLYIPRGCVYQVNKGSIYEI